METTSLVASNYAEVNETRRISDQHRTRHLGGAGLDVYEDEPKVDPRLLAMPNVVLAPHIGSATFETRTAMARIAATDVARFLRGEMPLHAIV